MLCDEVCVAVDGSVTVLSVLLAVLAAWDEGSVAFCQSVLSSRAAAVCLSIKPNRYSCQSCAREGGAKGSSVPCTASTASIL